MKPLFCIFAHPDDEAFGPGGSIAQFSKERDVYIVCVTDGQSQESFQHIKLANLGEIRREELLESARILGVKDVFFLGYPDGTLCNNVYHEIASKLTDILQKHQPDTLLTFDQCGISGHIDHIMVSMITRFVFNGLPFIKKLFYYCESEEVIGSMRDNYFIYMPKGYTSEDVDFVMDTSSVWDAKQQAMSAHKSQQKDIDTMLAILSKRKKEEYFLTVQK